jgi:glutathione S-transferase
LITLWELKGRNERRYSLFSWRTRMALKHKQLEFDTRPVCLTDKAAIEFSGGKTVPVIRDSDAVVRDSWKIAEYLEKRYPGAPALFGGPIGRGVTQVFNTWTDRAVVPAMFAVVGPDLVERVDGADEQYLRGTVEKATGKTLDELRAGRDEALRRLGRALEPVQAVLKRQAWICGEAPAYGDYVLFSVFQWARVMSPHEVLGPEDPLCAWRERVLDLFEGFARNVIVA